MLLRRGPLRRRDSPARPPKHRNCLSKMKARFGNADRKRRFLSIGATRMRGGARRFRFLRWSCLAGEQFGHRIQGVNLGYGLVSPNADDSRKAQRVSAIVTRRLLDIVERHLEHDHRLDRPPMPVILDRVPQKKLGVFADLGIREPRISLADIQELLPVAYRERIVREYFVSSRD